MKKRVCFRYALFLALLGASACSDNEQDVDPAALLDIYGRQYRLTEGVIWENNPVDIHATVPYVFEDTYKTAGGETVTDRVTGFAAGNGNRKVGNFMLSLYEEGLHYNAGMKASVGNGACICFHFATESTDRLTPGKYVYGTEKEAGTFIAYSSSNYRTDYSVTLAEITAGEVIVEQQGENYNIRFDCTTSFGGKVTGEYVGPLFYCRVPQQTSAFYENITLAGLLDSVVISESWLGDAPEISVSVDYSNGAAFLATSSGACKYAKDGGKELVDVALVWDKTTASFYFESPICMRALLGHSDTYNFPCHTIYMNAPSTFTAADFDRLGESSFAPDIQEEKVVFSTADFRPGYVFFRTGNGVEGVIHVKGFAPPDKQTTSEWGGWLITEKPVNPVLYLDVKCPANFVDPKIR